MERTLRAAVATLAIAAVAFASDNTVGTWKMNTARSERYQVPPLTSLIMVREATAGGSKTTATAERGDGTRISLSFTVKYDGKEVAVTCPGLLWDTVSIRQVNSNTLVETRTKKGGRYHVTVRDVVSNGGKTMTLRAQGTGPDGSPFTAVTVFDRQ